MCISDFPNLIYYAYIPSIILSVFFGLFVYFNNRQAILNKILFAISLAFFSYSAIDFLTWFPLSTFSYLLFQKLLFILVIIFFPLLLYFSYYQDSKLKISKVKHFLIWLPVIPISIFDLSNFSNFIFTIEINSGNCVVVEQPFYYYAYFISLLYLVWFAIVLVKKYRSGDFISKKRIKIVLIAISILIVWIVSFFKLQSYFGDNVLLFIPFGIVIFIGLLSYAITRYQLLNIKLIAAQALVYALVILIGSQFFFAQNSTTYILIGMTLVLAAVFGIFLIRSVKAEIRRKEELQELTEKLAIANDQLRKLDNAKSEFISIASHQLRTPLTAIKGYASLILEGTYGKVESNIAEPINKIYASNERLVQLVEELLNISKIESGKMEFNFEKKKVEDIINDLSDTFVILAKDKKLYFNIELPPEPLPEIEVDTSKIREVISNLIDNSIKYTRRGGVTVKIGLLKDITWSVKHRSEKLETIKGDIVRIVVSDTGIGIRKDDLPYLFAKFSRGKDTKRLHANGTGLGLYVGRNIIEAHHGRIWAESEGAEKGSRFIIELPLNQPKP